MDYTTTQPQFYYYKLLLGPTSYGNACHLHPTCAGIQSLQVLGGSLTYPSLYFIEGKRLGRTVLAKASRLALPM